MARNLAEAISKHVTLEVECVAQLCINLYQPRPQTAAGAGKLRGWLIRNANNQRRFPTFQYSGLMAWNAPWADRSFASRTRIG